MWLADQSPDSLGRRITWFAAQFFDVLVKVLVVRVRWLILKRQKPLRRLSGQRHSGGWSTILVIRFRLVDQPPEWLNRLRPVWILGWLFFDFFLTFFLFSFWPLTFFWFRWFGGGLDQSADWSTSQVIRCRWVRPITWFGWPIRFLFCGMVGISR